MQLTLDLQPAVEPPRPPAPKKPKAVPKPWTRPLLAPRTARLPARSLDQVERERERLALTGLLAAERRFVEQRCEVAHRRFLRLLDRLEDWGEI